MQVFNILLYRGVLIPFSKLPYSVLFFISDLLYYIIYRVIGYRTGVVQENIAKAFPEKTHHARQAITREFYRHLCDLVVESIKVFTISEQEIRERMKIQNAVIVDRFYHQRQTIIIAASHFNNWELFAVAIENAIKHKTVAFYKPLTNGYFDEKMRLSRSRFGLEMISTKKVDDVFQAEPEIPSAIIFGFDQSPAFANKSYWTTFLNQETAMTFGVEKYAKMNNYPVVYARINKLKRGFYVTEFLEAVAQPMETSHGEITKTINSLLEKDIAAHPPYWLWSHKRWKHKRPIDIQVE